MRLCVIGDGASPHVAARVAPFARLGHRVWLVSPTPAAIPGVEVVAAAGPGALWRLLRAVEADLFHVHYAASLAAWLLVAAGRPEPLVVSVMGGDVLDEEQIPLPPPARWMTTQVLRRADAVTAKTGRLAAAVERRGIAPARLSRVAWGVDGTVFRRVDAAALRARLGLGPDDRVVASPRLLRPFYNIDRVVAALPAILAVEPRARLVLTECGADPAYAEALRAQAAALGVAAAVVWAGTLAPAGMAELYSLAEVVVSVPPSDGLPQSLIEALACGASCVLSDLPLCREFVGDGDGVMFVPPTAEGVAAAVLAVLGDPGLAARLRAGASRVVAAVGLLADHVARVDALYRRLVAGGGGGAASPMIRAGCAALVGGWALRRGLWR